MGSTATWTRHSPAPTESRTKLPSSSGPDRASVLKDAFSSAVCIQVAITAVSSFATEYVALTGSGLAPSATIDPGNRGNPAGTPSQMRPHSVSVWVSADPPSAGALAAPDAARLGALAGTAEGDGLTDGSARPHAATSTRKISDTVGRRRRNRVDTPRV